MFMYLKSFSRKVILNFSFSICIEFGTQNNNAQADLRWVHISFCWFCHEVAHLKFKKHSSVQDKRVTVWQNENNDLCAHEDLDQPGNPPSMISFRRLHEETLGP